MNNNKPLLVLQFMMPLILFASYQCTPTEASDDFDKITQLLADGIKLYNTGKYADCESKLSEALENSQRAELRQKEVVAVFWLVKVWGSQQRFHAAEKLLASEIQTYHNKPHYLIDLLCDLGNLQMLESKVESEETYRQALEVADTQSFDADRIAPLIGLAALRLQKNNYSAAIPLYEKARTSIDNGTNFATREALYTVLADLYRKTGNKSKAEELYQNIIASYDEKDEKDEMSIAPLLYSYATLLMDRNQMAKAENICKRAFSIFSKYSDNGSTAKACRLSYGALLKLRGHADEAKTILNVEDNEMLMDAVNQVQRQLQDQQR